MKPTRRLLSSAALVCLFAFGLCRVPLHAAGDEEATHQAAAEDVLKAMHMDTFFETTTERMLSQLDGVSDGAARQLGNTPEAAGFQTRMRAQTREMLKKEFNWTLLKPEFTKSYADNFTTQELKELAVFYNTPIGQKLIAKQPELSQRMGRASQDRAKTVIPQIIQMVRDESSKIQNSAAPATAPGTPSAAGPAVAPAAPAASATPAASPAKP